MFTCYDSGKAGGYNQANKAAKVLTGFNETIWLDKFLRKESTVRIYKAIARPLLTYTAEPRPDTGKTKMESETTEMKTLRKIVSRCT